VRARAIDGVEVRDHHEIWLEAIEAGRKPPPADRDEKVTPAGGMQTTYLTMSKRLGRALGHRREDTSLIVVAGRQADVEVVKNPRQPVIRSPATR
jgi:hypothetical protein